MFCFGSSKKFSSSRTFFVFFAARFFDLLFFLVDGLMTNVMISDGAQEEVGPSEMRLSFRQSCSTEVSVASPPDSWSR